MGKQLDILAFAPHPDDAELGCGGSLISAADQGWRVAVADLSDGEMSSRGNPSQRKQEIAAATRLLGLCTRFSLGLPDGYIGADQAHQALIIDLIRETKPRIVLAPYYGVDRHPDHTATGNLVREACFFAGVRKMGSGRPHRPEQVYYYMLYHPFAPSFVINVSAVWDRKMAAITAYASQVQSVGPDPQTALSRPDFSRYLEAKAIYFGAMIGVPYGEPFYIPGPAPMLQFPGLASTPPAPDELPAFSVWH